MPIFEFECRGCGHRFEEIITLAELNEHGVKCPKCSRKKVERVVSAFGLGSAGGSQSGCGSGGFT